jgi:hypothetical protein
VTRPASLRFWRAERTSSATASLVQMLGELQLRTRPNLEDHGHRHARPFRARVVFVFDLASASHFGSWREYVVAGDFMRTLRDRFGETRAG